MVFLVARIVHIDEKLSRSYRDGIGASEATHGPTEAAAISITSGAHVRLGG